MVPAVLVLDKRVTASGKSMLKITDAGKARVASLEFAEELEKFVIDVTDHSIEEGIDKRVLIEHIAAALIGKESELDFKTDAELKEFQQFIHEHTEEINMGMAVCLGTLMARRTEGEPQT
jgi:thiamine phosphate synthase YjbQ (UPF0047 family)